MEYHQFFTQIDWLVVAGYLALTTWVGHALKGKQSTIRDFRGATLPARSVWLHHCHENSGAPLSGCPGWSMPQLEILLTCSGDWPIVARILVGIYFVKAFYEKEIYSPYDLWATDWGGETVSHYIFQIGGILGQSVRVLVAACP